MELTIGQLIKLILGVLVFVAVVTGFYLFFQNNIFEFFKTGTDDSEKTSGSIEEQNLNEEINKCDQCGFYCPEKECLGLGNCEWKPRFFLTNGCVARVAGGTG